MEQWEKNKRVEQQVDELFERSDKIIHELFNRILTLIREEDAGNRGYSQGRADLLQLRREDTTDDVVRASWDEVA